MHPALSVIIFTASSGAGYGLLFLLGLGGALGLLPPDPGFGLAAFAAALGLVTLGLLASLLHLGHPERAWRAFSQWRSSWLSREGVAAVATYVPALVLAGRWVLLGRNDGPWGLLAAALAAVTVYCTAMIYRSLRTVPRWHGPWTVPNYAALSLATGALWLNALAHPFGLASGPLTVLVAAAVAAAGLLRWYAWGRLDAAGPAHTIEAATGLGRFGRVRLLDAPHTEANYLLREMGFQIARKHAEKLRRLALLLAFAAPLALTLLAAVLPLAAIPAALAAVLASAGVLVERWLFFAEARHTVSLYYGAPAA